MSVNILVETRVAPRETFEIENPIIFAGEIAINEEGNGVKIGDGETRWGRLNYIENITQDSIDKWLKIAKESTNSHLVTLPDLNFAYTVVNAESNDLVESIVNTTIQNTNYLKVFRNEIRDSNINDTDGILLTLQTGRSQKFIFENIEESTKLPINYLGLEHDDQHKIFELADFEARNKINNLLDDFKLFNEEVDKGLVKSPGKEQATENYFLNATNQWSQVNLYGETIKMSPTSDVTIADVLKDVGAMPNLEIEVITDNTKPYYILGTKDKEEEIIYYSPSVYIENNVLYGVGWNDYAECRETQEVQAGRVVVENGDDTLSISTERLMLGGNIVSDTYGMLIGQTQKAKTPIALCGRVLAYPYENKEEYYPGAPVCTGPNGTVSLMNKDEVWRYPECIIGYVSAIPNYEEWNGVKVNDRIWIKVV